MTYGKLQTIALTLLIYQVYGLIAGFLLGWWLL